MKTLFVRLSFSRKRECLREIFIAFFDKILYNKSELSLVIIQERKSCNMYSLVPENMYEVAEKLTYFKEKGTPITEEEIIRQAVRDNSQQILDGYLEGPYWKASWKTEDTTLAFFDIMDNEVGTIDSLSGSFIEDFRTSAPNLIRRLAEKIQKIVNTH